MRYTTAALICAGTFAFAAPLHAAPLSAAGVLGNEATRAAIDETVSDDTLTDVRYGRGRHYGWYRGHHYGWYKHRRAWHPRSYGPRYYGYAPYRYRYY